MPGLDELRRRVEAAEVTFGSITTQSRKYSERLTHLVSQMEQAHADQHREIAALSARLGQFEQENGHLKGMLMGLLQAIENGEGSVIEHAVRDMESRIGRLVGADVAAQEPASVAAPSHLEDEGEDAVAHAAADIPDEAAADPEGPHHEPEPGDDAGLVAPEPETVALDDQPESGDELAESANSLLDRVEAAANALLAAGAESDHSPDETEFGDEFSALLESAMSGAPEADAVAEPDDDENASADDALVVSESEDVESAEDADVDTAEDDSGADDPGERDDEQDDTAAASRTAA